MELKVIKTTGHDITIKRTEYILSISPFDTGIRGTPTTLFTAKGQILVAAGSGSPAVLNLGSPGQSLTPDPNATLGLAWVAGSGSSVSTLTNRSGVQLNVGDVVVRHTEERAVTITTVTGYMGVFGIVQEAIANNASGAVATFAGHIVLVNCDTAAINIGEYLITSSTAGRATRSMYRTSASFAMALSAKGTDLGQVFAILFPMTPLTVFPSDIPNLRGWYRPESLDIFAEGAAIGQWDDSSGGAFHLTQATAGLRPLCNRSVVAGHHVAHFDGVDDHLFRSVTWLNGATPKTLVTVNRTNTNNLGGVFGKTDHGNTTSLFLLRNSGTTPDANVIGDVISGTVFDNTSYYIAGLTSDGSTIQRLYRNGLVVGTRSGAHSTVTGNITMGRAITAYWGGRLAEAIAWEKELTSVELASVWSYLSAKFNIP